MKQSETKTIKRSQINLNPCNPKRHTDEQVRLQKKNLRQVGFLGGVVWNEASGNLIDGHRRIKALDQINKYDGTPETDYEIKVEATSLDDAQEKQQLTYMAVGNTKADYNLIAPYIESIDYASAGLSHDEYKQILSLRDSVQVDNITSWDDDFIQPPVTTLEVQERTSEEIAQEHAEKPKMTKEQVKAEKLKCTDVAVNRQEEEDLYCIINFRDAEQKRIFCELLDIQQSTYLNLKPDETDSLLEMITG